MQKKLDYVDALRGIAVLGVLMAHVGLQSLAGIYHTIAELGAKGVQLFYFISAFTLFLSSNGRHKVEKNRNTNFFIRRFFRIAPLYYLGIIYYGVAMPYYIYHKIDYLGVFLNFVFLHGFSPMQINSIVIGGWTIAVEMLFYLFVPFLVLKITSLNKAVVLLIFTLYVKALFNSVLIHNPLNFDHALWTNYMYWYLPNQAPSFAFGIIFYFITIQVNIRQEILANIRFYALIFIFIIILLVDDLLILKIGVFNPDFLFGIGFLALASVLRKYTISIFVNSFTELVGKLSFSMYLIHYAIIFWFSKFGLITVETQRGLLNFFLSYLLVLAVTIVFSFFSYSYIEVKAQEYGKLIINKMTR